MKGNSVRCESCDNPMSQLEMGRRSPVTKEEYGLCTKCLKEAGLLYTAVENPIVSDDVYLDISGLSETPEFQNDE